MNELRRLKDGDSRITLNGAALKLPVLIFTYS
jgi:hypothetical protein